MTTSASTLTIAADLAMATPRILVVAAVIWHADSVSTQDSAQASTGAPTRKILLSLRRADQHQGNLWEFPGGKVESGEEHMAALRRELHEELGITVVQAQAWMQVSHDYPDKSVLLDIWQVSEFSGEPASREQQELRWVDVNELPQLAFPAANQPIVEKLLQQLSTQP